MRRLDLNIDEIVSLYKSGLSSTEIAERLGCGATTIKRRLRGAGVELTGVYIDLPVEEIAERYRAGESINALAKAYDVSRPTITRRLKESGVEIRGIAKANRLMMKERTPEEHKRNTEAAHKVIRNKPPEFFEKLAIKQARTRERTGSKIGDGERRFAEWLLEDGFSPVLQKAVYKYNIDVAVRPVAIEIHVNPVHPHSDSRIEQRIIELLKRNWHVLYIKMCTSDEALTERAREKTVAFIEAAQRDESMRREYRVIRGAGELVARGRLDGDDLATVPASESASGPMG